MKILPRNSFPCALLAISMMCWSGSGFAGKDGDWALTGYSATLTEDPFGEVLTGQASYDSDFQLFSLALSKQIPAQDPDYDLEWEVQLARHYNGQNHYELNGLYALRWYPLPWDSLVESSFAVGLGVSWASETPPFEVARHAKAEQLLAYILLEVEIQPRSWESWSLVLRSHHRSGAFGLFNDVDGASNSIGFGLKYRF